MAKPRKPTDVGLEQIAAWAQWLVAANVQRMRDDGYDEDAITRERGAVETLAASIAERMRYDYLMNSRRPS